MPLEFWIAAAVGTSFIGGIGAWLCVSPYDEDES